MVAMWRGIWQGPVRWEAICLASLAAFAVCAELQAVTTAPLAINEPVCVSLMNMYTVKFYSKEVNHDTWISPATLNKYCYPALNGHSLQSQTPLWPERNQPQLESHRVVLASHCSAAGKFRWEEVSISRGIIYGFRPKMNCILLARSFDVENIELTIPTAGDQRTSKYLPTILQAPLSPYATGMILSTLVSPIIERWKMTVATQEACNHSRNWPHITALRMD